MYSCLHLKWCYFVKSPLCSENWHHLIVNFFGVVTLADLPGFTRSVYKRDHALITPESHVFSPLPEWRNMLGAYLVTPAMGSHFVMYLAKMQENSESGFPANDVERWIHLLTSLLIVSIPCSLMHLLLLLLLSAGIHLLETMLLSRLLAQQISSHFLTPQGRFLSSGSFFQLLWSMTSISMKCTTINMVCYFWKGRAYIGWVIVGIQFNRGMQFGWLLSYHNGTRH